MLMEQIRRRRQNASLTKMIINLHSRGFTEEFYIRDAKVFTFSTIYPEESISSFEVLLINQVFDELSGGYKYIHAIESDSGVRGLLLIEECLFTPACRQQASRAE
jgi:hypothetical protein